MNPQYTVYVNPAEMRRYILMKDGRCIPFVDERGNEMMYGTPWEPSDVLRSIACYEAINARIAEHSQKAGQIKKVERHTQRQRVWKVYGRRDRRNKPMQHDPMPISVSPYAFIQPEEAAAYPNGKGW